MTYNKLVYKHYLTIHKYVQSPAEGERHSKFALEIF